MLSGRHVVVLGLITVAATGPGCSDAEAIVQPIQFSHASHVVANEMECVDCHRTVKTSRIAGRPGVEVCGSCHDVMLGDSEEEERVVAHVEEEREIPWRRLSRLNPSDYFSHARHVTLAGLECETCHGAISEQKTPPSAPLMVLTMDDCIDCHRINHVRDDCNACHR